MTGRLQQATVLHLSSASSAHALYCKDDCQSPHLSSSMSSVPASIVSLSRCAPCCLPSLRSLAAACLALVWARARARETSVRRARTYLPHVLRIWAMLPAVLLVRDSDFHGVGMMAGVEEPSDPCSKWKAKKEGDNCKCPRNEQMSPGCFSCCQQRTVFNPRSCQSQAAIATQGIHTSRMSHSPFLYSEHCHCIGGDWKHRWHEDHVGHPAAARL